MTEPRQDELDYRLLDRADEVVDRIRTSGEIVAFPRWFEIQISHPDLPGDVVLSVTVDRERGPLLVGIRGDRGSTVGYAEVARELKRVWQGAGGGSFDGLLQFAAAVAAGALATSRAIDPMRDQIELSDDTLNKIRTVRDLYASRAFSAARPQRRRLVTRELLADVAKVYRAAHEAGRPPTVAVAEHFQTSHSTATRWVTQARKARELGPAQGTKPGEVRPASPTD